MTEISPSMERRIADTLKTSVLQARLFATGNNTRLYLIDCQDRRRLVAKIANNETGKLSLEGWMLGYLGKNSSLPVPVVYYCDDKLLLMSYVESAGPLGAKEQRHAAGLLADLHNISADRFGMERDTLIGPLQQPNPGTTDWIQFFRDHRLLYMARKALEEGRIDSSLMRNIEALAEKLESLIDRPDKPSLIHGDIWSGNILSFKGQIAAFIDPAIYYADAEIELAFITLFNSFGEPFFKRYGELRPVRPGFFEVRRDIYNLYPLLVHTRLFGGSYKESVKRIVNRFI